MKSAQANEGRLFGPAKIGRAPLLILLAILAVAALLRFYRIGAHSLWTDELWSIELSMGNGSRHNQLAPQVIHFDQPDLTGLSAAAPMWRIWFTMAGCAQPPIYHLLLRMWMDVFGNGPGATRTLSAIFSLAAIVVLFDFCRLLYPVRVALLASALMAVAGAQIEFGQETRSYSMLMCLALSCGDLVVRMELFGVSWRRWMLLVAALTTTILTHYFSVGAIAGLLAYAMIRLRGRRRAQVLAAFAVALAVVLLIWGRFFLEQTHTVPGGYLSDTDPGLARRILFRFIDLPTKFLAGNFWTLWLPIWIQAAIFAVAVVLPLARLPWRRDLLIWGLWMAGVFGSVAAADVVRHSKLLQFYRYTVLASPAMFVMLASWNWPRRALLRELPVWGAMALAMVAALPRFIDGVTPKEDWKQLARDVDQNAAPDELLVFYNNDAFVLPGVWFMGIKYYSPDSRRPWLILNAAPDAKLMRQLETHRTLWLVGANPERDWPYFFDSIFVPAAPPRLLHTSAGALCQLVRTRPVSP
jgi:hypothetical protein